MTDHEHKHTWKLIEGGMVIDTFPQEYPYRCECGAFTHDTKTGEPCRICDPTDYAKRRKGRVS